MNSFIIGMFAGMCTGMWIGSSIVIPYVEHPQLAEAGKIPIVSFLDKCKD